MALLVRLKVRMAVDLHPSGQYTFLCTGSGPVCLPTVRWSPWLLKFPSCPLIHKTNPVKLKVKPQNHFIPSSPKLYFISPR